AASKPMGEAIGSKDYTPLAFQGGHIGIYVSGRAQALVPPAIHDWLARR
ncbi:MAG: class III poly(R)-hydroxyalkanoic acid synthase subunit PhaC, partial [Luteibacter sp.]